MKIKGRVRMPGDKSISHRALLIASLSQGESLIEGLNRGEDCLATLDCLRALGVKIEEQSSGNFRVQGRNFNLQPSTKVFDCGNSGTTLRLLAGILAGQDFTSILTGDASLRTRPMGRIIQPLKAMGAHINGQEHQEQAPLAIQGGFLKGIEYTLPVASAQVKSAILFAAMQAQGQTTIVEPLQSRDHTELMLQWAGAEIEAKDSKLRLFGGQILQGQRYQIPGDFSSAAFLLGAAASLPGSELLIEDVGLNPTRLGFYRVLADMGAQLEIVEQKLREGELLGSILVRGGQLQGVTITAEMIPSLVDEVPILAVLATQAEGQTIITGAQELRVKESDRLASLTSELGKLGAKITETVDGLVIEGPSKLGGGLVESYGDHRLALAFQVASLHSKQRIKINGEDVVEISFPDFKTTWQSLVRG